MAAAMPVATNRAVVVFWHEPTVDVTEASTPATAATMTPSCVRGRQWRTVNSTIATAAYRSDLTGPGRYPGGVRTTPILQDGHDVPPGAVESTPNPSRATAATPPSRMRPSKRCSVPMWRWPSSMASRKARSYAVLVPGASWRPLRGRPSGARSTSRRASCRSSVIGTPRQRSVIAATLSPSSTTASNRCSTAVAELSRVWAISSARSRTASLGMVDAAPERLGELADTGPVGGVDEDVLAVEEFTQAARGCVARLVEFADPRMLGNDDGAGDEYPHEELERASRETATRLSPTEEAQDLAEPVPGAAVGRCEHGDAGDRQPDSGHVGGALDEVAANLKGQPTDLEEEIHQVQRAADVGFHSDRRDAGVVESHQPPRAADPGRGDGERVYRFAVAEPAEEQHQAPVTAHQVQTRPADHPRRAPRRRARS